MNGMTMSRTLIRILTNSNRFPVFVVINYGVNALLLFSRVPYDTPYLSPQVTPYICLRVLLYV